MTEEEAKPRLGIFPLLACRREFCFLHFSHSLLLYLQSLVQWVNHILAKSSPPIVVSDISTGGSLLPFCRSLLCAEFFCFVPAISHFSRSDFRDGLVLAELLANLSGQQVAKRIKKPLPGRKLQHFDKLGNLAASFDFMNRLGVKLSNIGSDDLATGNEKLTQGLIWTLVNFFLVDSGDDEESLLSPGNSKRKLSPKQRLLEWVKLLVNSYPGVDVQSWKTGFSDGLALCALVHFHAPGELDFYALDPAESGHNMKHAFDVLEQRWRLPKLVRPEDLLQGRADEDMLVAFIAMCKKELKVLPDAASPLVSARAIIPDEEASWESRKALRQVVNCAKEGDRSGVDKALVVVLEIFKSVIDAADHASDSATAKRRDEIHAVRQNLDRALRDLMQDSVYLCQQPASAVKMRLVRRDVMALCAAEGEALSICADSSDVSKKAIIARLRSLRNNKEPEHIMQVSKQLEEESRRLTSATKSKVQAQQSQMDHANSKVAHLMIAELDSMSPRFGPIAAKLAVDPTNKETQKELAELNRDITGIMADLELTLTVDVSKQLRSMDQALGAALERVRAPNASLPSCQRIASNIGSCCQTGLSSARSMSEKLPKDSAKPILQAADNLDEALSQLQLDCELCEDPKDLASSLQAMREAASSLSEHIARGQQSFSQSSAVPEVRASVSQLLLAIRGADFTSIKRGSQQLQKGSKRAIMLAQERAATHDDDKIAQAYVADLQLLTPLHDAAVLKAAANPNDRLALRRVAETARDILSITLELDEVTRAPPEEDEFSSLQSLLGDAGGADFGSLMLEDDVVFDVVSDSRNVADAARQAVAEDPFSKDANDILNTILELEMALPGIMSGDGEDAAAAASVVNSLPTLEKAVRVRDEKREQERLEAPEDDMLRLGRYARAGAEEEQLRTVQFEVSKKSQVYAEKKKCKTRNRADPIRQQRIMEAVSDLEAMAPLQMESFSNFLEEPELVVARDEFDDLSASVAGLELGGMFSDLLLTTSIDLDLAICALQDESRRDDSPAPLLRKVDLETLAPRQLLTTMAPEMLQLDVLDTPQSARKNYTGSTFNAEEHAQRVVECLAEGGDEDDEDVLEGSDFSKVLDEFIVMLLSLVESTEHVAQAAGELEDGNSAVLVVDQACRVIAKGKLVAVSLPGDDDESSLMYSGLEDLANRAAELVFAVQEHLHEADAESVSDACNGLAKQVKIIEQLASSQALLLSVDTFEIPTAESVLAQAHQLLDAAWQEECRDPQSPPTLELLCKVRVETNTAVAEWAWEEFLNVCAETLLRTHSTVPLIQDSGRKVLLRQAGEAFLGRSKQLLWTTVHKAEDIGPSRIAMLDTCEALTAACKMLDSKAFQAERTIENCPYAARIHNALVEGLSLSPKEGELVRRINIVQENIAPLTAELRSFKSVPKSFATENYVSYLVEILSDTSFICRGLDDDATKGLLQGLREQLADTGTVFLYCALDITDYPDLSMEDESLVALKRLSMALLQVGKWARKALLVLEPARSVSTDPDTARIARQLKGLSEEKLSMTRDGADLAVISGLLVGFKDALAITDKAVLAACDPAAVSDAIVHVILGIGSLVRHFGHDAHVGHLRGMAEVLGQASYELIFRLRDLAAGSGTEDRVQESAGELSVTTDRMLASANVLSSKFANLRELQRVAETLKTCQALLAEPLPTPARVSSMSEFDVTVRREATSVEQLCSKVDSSFDIGGFSSGLVSCAGAVRNNASIADDGAAVAALMRVNDNMITAGIRALRVLEVTATSDAKSDAFAMASVELKEEVGTVALCASKMADMVSAMAAAAPSSSSLSPVSGGSHSSSSKRKSSSNGSSPKGGSPTIPRHTSPLQQYQGPQQPAQQIESDRQTLLIGKSLSSAINDLGLGQTAVFSSYDEMPSGLSGSLELLEPTEKKIHLLLRTQKPGPELQRALLYFMNLLKHLASGYLKNDVNGKLPELIRLCKDWAAKVIGAMQSMEVSNQPNVGAEVDCMKQLHAYMTSSVILCCVVCSKSISGQYTTADGVSFHDTCFKCSTCGKSISGQYYREGDLLYCAADIPMTNSLVCARCNETIELGTNYLECRDQTLHRECFSCVDCGLPLLSSHFFVREDDNQIVCRDHA